MEQLQIKTAIQIARTPREVYQAIIDPEKMVNYFISQSTGKMEQGKSVTWQFPEFEGDVLIEVKKIIPAELISFEWEGAKGRNLKDEITLIELPDDTTVVKITEGKIEADKAGIEWLGGYTEGWAHVLA